MRDCENPPRYTYPADRHGLLIALDSSVSRCGVCGSCKQARSLSFLIADDLAEREHARAGVVLQWVPDGEVSGSLLPIAYDGIHRLSEALLKRKVKFEFYGLGRVLDEGRAQFTVFIPGLRAGEIRDENLKVQVQLRIGRRSIGMAREFFPGTVWARTRVPSFFVLDPTFELSIDTGPRRWMAIDAHRLSSNGRGRGIQPRHRCVFVSPSLMPEGEVSEPHVHDFLVLESRGEIPARGFGERWVSYRPPNYPQSPPRVFHRIFAESLFSVHRKALHVYQKHAAYLSQGPLFSKAA